MKVEAMKWTGSGDGIVSGGNEVVMWRRRDKSWELAWSFKPKVTQVLVSTTWSVNGFSATAAQSKLKLGGSSSPSNEAIKCVLVCQGDGQSPYPLAELHHPMPVSMIQWRPSTGKLSSRHIRHAFRPVLLTCCLDGAVRLWGEIDDGRIRRAGKDGNDHKAAELSFCVIAVIEVNQIVDGLLGFDFFVHWSTEVEGVAFLGGKNCYLSCSDDLRNDTAGRCEWLIGFGPKNVAIFWAVHCLDDFAPVRFPRVTLWKEHQLASFEMESTQLLIHKILMMRTQDSGPPVDCSLVHLLPNNSFAWIHLYSQASTNFERNSTNDTNSENPSTKCARRLLEVEGHTGKVIQLAIHPFSFEVELAASLDGNGMLLFWSLSTFFNSHIGLPVSSPSWKFRGKSFFDNSAKYTCMCWAPTLLGRDQVLLMGYAGGVDCFVVYALDSDDEKIHIQKLFSIPFNSGHHEQSPSTICSIPLPSICNGKLVHSKFLLFSIWMDDFRALSWEITIHCSELQGSFCSEHLQNFEFEVSDKKYFVTIDPSSSDFPAPHNDDKVTSFAVVCPSEWTWTVEQKLSYDEMGPCGYVYHIVTGCSNGTLKLWRSMPYQSQTLDTNWCLVGVLTSADTPILEISPSACCLNIATVSKTSRPNHTSILSIWECMYIQSAGSFMLDDKLYFDGEIVAVKWLRLGNGQLLLGVSLRNELHIYVRRRHGGQYILKCEKPLEGNSWVCIAVSGALPAIYDFLWGPKGTAVVVHDEYFRHFSHFLSLSEYTGSNKHAHSTIFADPKQSQIQMVGGLYHSQSTAKMKGTCGLESIINVESSPSNYKRGTGLCFWSMSVIAEVIGGSLPLFHPEVLLINLYTGNWKRSLIVLHHLVKHIGSKNFSKLGYGAKMPRNIIFPVPLSNYFEGMLPSSSGEKSFQWSISPFQTGKAEYTSFGGYGALSTSLSSSPQSEFDNFIEALERLYKYTYITEVEKLQAIALIDLLREVSSHHSKCAYGSLDEPGRRFWVAVRFQQLYYARRFNRLPQVEEIVVSSELIGWAFHSDCHDNLFDSLLPTEPTWDEMRSIGVGFWYSNVSQLRAKMERLARQRYMKNKDPKACALLYIALNRVQVLSGLFKMSKDDKDKPLAGFLSRNFQDDRNKEAALKNAYVLLGKHQLELAIAFFLLGGDASSAVTVCAKNLGDEQLALVICRLLEGHRAPLERHLISKSLLPSAVSKGDIWMASFLEWELGNYSVSFMRMLGGEMGSEDNISLLSSSHVSFLDPSVGQHCFMLALKNSMKNAIGEFNATILCRLAALMSFTSLSKCGLHLEALECLSSSSNLFGGSTHGIQMHSPTCSIFDIVKPSPDKSSSNWIKDDDSHFISHFKLHLAMQYMSNVLREHPSCANIDKPFSEEFVNSVIDCQGYQNLLKEFQDELTATIAYFQQKFSLVPYHLLSMILLYLHCNGLTIVGHSILQDCLREFLPQGMCNGTQNLIFSSSNLLLKATEEVSSLFVKYVAEACKNCYSSTLFASNRLSADGKFFWLSAWGFSNQGIVWSFWHLRAMLPLFLRFNSEEFYMLLSSFLDLFEFKILFASAWLQKNFKAVLETVRPILVTFIKGRSQHEIKMTELKTLSTEIVKLLTHDLSGYDLGVYVGNNGKNEQHSEEVPVDKIWHIMTASLWMHMSEFLHHQLSALSEELGESLPSPSLSPSDCNSNNLRMQCVSVSGILTDNLKFACIGVSSYCSKQFAAFLLHVTKESSQLNLFDSEDGLSRLGAANEYQLSEISNGRRFVDFEELWHFCNDPKVIHEALLQEYHNWLPYYKEKLSSGWGDAYINITREFESEEICDKEDRVGSPNHSSGSPLACLSPDDHPFKGSGDKDSHDSRRIMPFQNPKDIYKRNGELIEALCINSIDQCQGALASNRKGIIFFNWEDGALHGDKSEYIWEEADWPHNGWAGSESIPVPTYVSPGVGLGSKEGAHLGLGGATIGASALVRQGRDLKGGAFGISGYAGVGASNLGWGIQEGFDEYVDPPATVDNIKTMAFASHPSRSFFLVGSSNTHVYLWEFGKDRATATYGVLPAANVPPPYALASVSALRFDHFGHRFVTGALDGTVCTWQLEVGGRSNVCPSESSACFNNHTADVTYVTASGSIVAAAGYSSSGVNVVVWDTLAPPATSKASIMCHEGGARSLAVFDNDIGSGSISPLILTGGKGGDVGLHDFRYIATGRTKKHKHLDTGEQHMHAPSSVDMRSKTGDQNRNGMLWYIPKAHSGCVTKICTIPNTSFFLTGSKDGDVKLWDAKRAKLVFHWPKLHERHTFFQPSSRGFGGVVRSAVTDIQAVSHGFLTCGGDGLVKFVRFQDFAPVPR
ncbi:uncharacterized protein LOC127260850 isoform X2 [Andrographis paniculata]|nr:uncharacterized protein LOC127260850 isoform X2 [Andrographis paniculata]